jgi:hypothetical protein
MELPALVIHTSLEEEIRNYLPKKLPFFSVKTFSSDALTFYRGQVLATLTNNPYCVVFMPGEWTSLLPNPPPEILLKCVTGLVRYVCWKPLMPPRWSFPNLVIPEFLDKEIVQMLINQTIRTPGWGLHTSMPPGSTIITERIYSKQKLAERVRDSIRILENRDSIFSTVGERIKESLDLLVETVFQSGARLPNFKPMTLQMGIQAGIVSHSLRWQGEMITTQEWLNPGDAWSSVIQSNSAMSVQFSLETQETEVTVYNLPLPIRELGDVRPLLIDSMTLERIDAAREVFNETANFFYETFE